MNVYEKIVEYAKTERVALRYRGETRSYADVCRAMVNLRDYLVGRLGDDTTPVIIYGHKEIDFIPCMLGCALAGHPYVPVDITFSQSRLELVIEEAEPRVILDFTDTLVIEGCEVLWREQLAQVLTGGDADMSISDIGDTVLPPNPEAIQYVLFTSGSTGRPKGVKIKFSNVESYLGVIYPSFYAGEGEHVVLNSFAYSFDLSVGYIYPALYCGYTLHCTDKRMVENLGELFADLKTSGVQTVVATPSLIEMCNVSQSFGRDILPAVQRFIFCGETLTNELARNIRARFGDAEIINTYGPTEATVLVTVTPITDEMIDAERSLPIGSPRNGQVLRIVDENGNVLPPRERGELQIIGSSVSPGYFKRPDLTSRAFFVDAETGLQGYNTGDICYFDDVDGNYYFCYRNDFQIKLNGYRIELGDVENNLLKIPYVSRAAVIPVMDDGRVVYLAAFVVLSERTEASAVKQQIAIKRDLGQLAASYMVPRKIVIKDDFPVNTNGKTDKKALEAELRG